MSNTGNIYANKTNYPAYNNSRLKPRNRGSPMAAPIPLSNLKRMVLSAEACEEKLQTMTMKYKTMIMKYKRLQGIWMNYAKGFGKTHREMKQRAQQTNKKLTKAENEIVKLTKNAINTARTTNSQLQNSKDNLAKWHRRDRRPRIQPTRWTYTHNT